LLQVAKLLILLSPCMKKVAFRFIDKCVASSVARAVHKHHCWFYELVSAVNVHFRCIYMEDLENWHFSETDMEQLIWGGFL
jgi:hypothetical protein